MKTKKWISVIALTLFMFTGMAQVRSIIKEKVLIEDLTQYPIYPRLVDSINGQMTWKPERAYLDSVKLYRITYISDGLLVKGYVAEPVKEGSYPCIIFNRGGNREFGAMTIGTLATLLGKMASNGYVVIASQYRGVAGGEGMEEFGGAEIKDVVVLPEVLMEFPSADTERIGMMGWSRGGMTTYLAMKRMPDLKAVVVGGAVSDQVAMLADRPEMENVMKDLIPDYGSEDQHELKERSVLYWVDELPRDMPMLILHGGSDWRVKPEQSIRLALECDRYRIPYRLVVFEGSDHGISEHRDEVMEQTINWFDRFVKRSEELPNTEFHGR